MLRQKIKKKGYKILYTILYKGHQIHCKIRNPKIQGAYVLCQYEKEVLIIKNSYRSYWTLPCGGIDKGEQPIEAAARELREEVGIVLPVHALRFHAKIFYDEEDKRDNIHLFSHRFSHKPHVTIDNKEVEDYRWIRKEELPHYTLFVPIIPYVQSALEK